MHIHVTNNNAYPLNFDMHISIGWMKARAVEPPRRCYDVGTRAGREHGRRRPIPGTRDPAYVQLIGSDWSTYKNWVNEMMRMKVLAAHHPEARILKIQTCIPPPCKQIISYDKYSFRTHYFPLAVNPFPGMECWWTDEGCYTMDMDTP